MELDVYKEVTEALGPRAREILTDGIRLREDLGLPVFELGPPFRLARVGEVPSWMEVKYETFVVRPGCLFTPVICDDTRSLQIASIAESRGETFPPVPETISISPLPP